MLWRVHSSQPGPITISDRCINILIANYQTLVLIFRVLVLSLICICPYGLRIGYYDSTSSLSAISWSAIGGIFDQENTSGEYVGRIRRSCPYASLLNSGIVDYYTGIYSTYPIRHWRLFWRYGILNWQKWLVPRGWIFLALALPTPNQNKCYKRL